MKKIIYSLSIAMAFGLAANAANPAMQAQKASSVSKDVTAMQIAPGSMELQRVSPAKKQVKRRATSAEDFVGTYQWAGRNQLQGVVFPNEGVLTIESMGGNKMLVTGFDYAAEPGLEANFDPATGRLYIPNQFTYLNTYYNEDVWFINWTVFRGETEDGSPGYGLKEAPKDKSFYFTLTEDGIQAGDIDPNKWENFEYTDEELEDVCCIAVNAMPNNDGGFFWMCFGVKGTELHDFEFVADQWQELDYADFTDAWFNIYWDGPAPHYDVPCYYDKTQPGRYMLYNPYAFGGADENPFVYYDINIDPSRVGYLIFDISDPECVVFEPLIYGITIDFRAAEEDPVYPQPVYCFNLEGYYYYVADATKEDIIVSFDQNEQDITTFNARTHEIEIYNAMFTFGMNTNMTYWNNVPMTGSIVLPSNYADGVETILGEDNDAPAVYFNLQGQRVNNPEKGQILIVKKGNKTTKQVIR